MRRPCSGVLVVLFAAAASATAVAQPATALRVSLTFAPDLAVPARIAVIEQAAAIWDGSGISLDWQAGGGTCEPGLCVRALIVRRARSVQSGESARQVGELVRLDGGGAAIIVSIDEAERILRAAPPPRPRFGLLEGDPLGTVIGRAVAHELGHYVLATATHAPRGLMRARFAPAEFSDLGSRAFALDPDAVAWLHARAAEGPVSTFSYNH